VGRKGKREKGKAKSVRSGMLVVGYSLCSIPRKRYGLGWSWGIFSACGFQVYSRFEIQAKDLLAGLLSLMPDRRYRVVGLGTPHTAIGL